MRAETINITKGTIDNTIAIFEKQEKEKEDMLRSIFNAYHNNTEPYSVLLKVTLLNSLYGTQLTAINAAKQIR